MLDFRKVSKGFGGPPLLDKASFRMEAGKRVGLAGPNGAGKSTVFAIICGDRLADAGEVSLPKSVRMAHLRQQPHLSADCGRSILEHAEDAIPELRDVQRELEAIEARLPELSADARAAAGRRIREIEAEIAEAERDWERAAEELEQLSRAAGTG